MSMCQPQRHPLVAQEAAPATHDPDAAHGHAAGASNGTDGGDSTTHLMTELAKGASAAADVAAALPPRWPRCCGWPAGAPLGGEACLSGADRVCAAPWQQPCSCGASTHAETLARRLPRCRMLVLVCEV